MTMTERWGMIIKLVYNPPVGVYNGAESNGEGRECSEGRGVGRWMVHGNNHNDNHRYQSRPPTNICASSPPLLLWCAASMPVTVGLNCTIIAHWLSPRGPGMDPEMNYRWSNRLYGYGRGHRWKWGGGAGGSIWVINAWEGKGMEGRRRREKGGEGLASSLAILVGAMTGQ